MDRALGYGPGGRGFEPLSGYQLHHESRINEGRDQISGCGSVWLERRVRDAETGGSNPLTPTKFKGNTSWPTSSHGRHGGDFIRIVEKALHREDLEDVQKFLDEQFDACGQAEQANPVLKNRRKKEEKAARRAAKKKYRDMAQSG